MTSYSRKNGAIILCAAYCFIEVLLSTELVYLVPMQLLSFLKYCVAAVMAFYVLIEQRNVKLNRYHLPVMFCFALGALVTLFARSPHILILVLMVVLLRDCTFDEVLKPMFYMLWAAFIFTVFMSLLDFYPNIEYERNGEWRFALGFGTPTLGQSVVLFLFLTKFYLSRNSKNVAWIVFYLLLSVVVYIFTAARTGFYLSLAAVVFIVAYKLLSGRAAFKKLSSSFAVALISAVLPFAFLLLTLLLTKLYEAGVPFAVKLNALLSTRLLLQMNAINDRAVTLFGQNIVWFTSEGIYIGIDNSYLYHLYNYGLIVFFGAMLAYGYMLVGAWRRGDSCMILILVIILIDAMVEPYMLDFKYNYFILCIGGYVRRRIFQSSAAVRGVRPQGVQ